MSNESISPQAEKYDAAPSYRYDIDGLRALAIALVVIYHVWFGRVSGGVDVFLMISAFFLTASLVRRAERGEKTRLGRYWAGRFRRLVPPAAVTVLGVLVTAYLVFPQTEWPRVWRESWASLFYFENWALAFSEVDYYNLDGALASPLQHFWSLSVQGQVFILFPIVIALIAWFTRRKRVLLRPLLVIAFAGIFAWSLWFSIIETQARQEFAYFDTRTRVWEFAAGALIALALPFIRLPGRLAAPLGWLGVAGIVLCGIVLDVQGGFPGYLALWPVLCTAAVIVGGTNPVGWGPTRLLASAPMRFVGKDAYALYLVHWPVLITWRVMHDDAPMTFEAGALIIGISIVLARILTWLIDGRLRKPLAPAHQFRRGLLTVTASIMLVATPLAMWERAEHEHAAELLAEYEQRRADFVDPMYPGAATLFANMPSPAGVAILPDPLQLRGEWYYGLTERCVGDTAPSDPIVWNHCYQTEDAEHREQMILVVGDSHAQQLLAPLVVSARGQDLGVRTVTMHGCNVGFDEAVPSFQVEEVCRAYRAQMRDYALESRPTAVYVPVTRSNPGGQDHLLAGVHEFIDPLIDAGITVIAVRSTPRFNFSPYDCAAKIEQAALDAGAETNFDACVTPSSEPLSELSPLDALDDEVVKVDFTPWICPDGACRAVIGNIAVYFDNWHVGRSYAETLAPVLEQQLIAGGLLSRYSGLEPSDAALGETQFLQIRP